MITEKEIVDYLQTEVPELDVICLNKPLTIYGLMQRLLDLTRQYVCSGNMDSARKHFYLVERLYLKGNRTVKNAVENVYVFALENIIYFDCKDKSAMATIMPASLHQLFINQIVKSNI